MTRWVVLEEHAVDDADRDADGTVRDAALERWVRAICDSFLDRCAVLRQRGAIIEYAEVYRRGRPEGDFTQLTPETVDVAIVTSNEGLRNLWDMASDQGRAWLVYLPLVVMSRRTAQLAEELGFVCPAVVAPEQTDAGLVRALHYWRESLDPPVFRNIG